MNEQKLIEKLRLIDALFSGAATRGEEVAAELARERILERLRLMEKAEPLVEYRFSMADMWARKVFVAMLRRYGIKPYRYSRQRYTTVMGNGSGIETVCRRDIMAGISRDFQNTAGLSLGNNRPGGLAGHSPG